MKKSILFVDDEVMVLQALQRMLRSLRGEWEMEFVESGEAALRLLEQKPFDVVVSDMRMPLMNGAELLAEVRKRRPATVRLILSGYADKELILKCVDSTHQYLIKPCDPETLKATVRRMTNLEGSLQSEQIKAVVGRMNRLPSLPDLYVRLVEKTKDPNVTAEDIGALVGQDIGMTAQVLKLTNSAFFGLPRRLASAEEAVAYLGLDTIKSLVLTIHAFSQFETGQTELLKMESLWRHSLRVAAAAKRISIAEDQPSKAIEEAFTAGILHDLGKLVMAVNLRAEYTAAMHLAESGLTVTVAEEKVFGTNHADVGGYLIGLWGLPAPVVEAVSLHHCPSRAPGSAFSPLASVHAANVLAWKNCDAIQGALPPELDRNYLSRIAQTSRIEAWRAALAEN